MTVSVIAISSIIGFNGFVYADESVTDFGTAIPTQEEFTNALVPRVGIKTRGIGQVKKTNPKPVAVNLSLTFDFDSADLTERTKTTLDSLGTALKGSQLQSYKFRIEGHTDALGESGYNDNLSKQRADSVSNYLTNNYGVAVERMVVVGKGETELIDPKHPGSSKNRRVKIVNLGLVK